MKTKLTLSVKTKTKLSLKYKIIAGASFIILVFFAAFFYNMFFNNKDAAAETDAVATIIVSGSANADGTYSDLSNTGGAFAKINATAQTGKTITITISGVSSNETGTISLNAGTWTSLTIYPVSAGSAISGNTNASIISLNGADNVIIDGRLNGTGTTKELSITNINTGTFASAVKYINSAENNTIKYCNISSSCNNAGVGIVNFTSSPSGNGNDNNIVEYCNISGIGNNRPINAIFTSGGTGRENSGNIIRFNNIYDFFSPNSSSYGINISYNSTDWTIEGNSFYETSTLAPSGAFSYNVIRANTGNNHIIKNNYIGGSAPQCGGSAWVTNSSKAFYTAEIWINGGTACTVSNNTIQNINYTSIEDNPWDGIFINSGNASIIGNTIGASTGTGSITINTPMPAASAVISGGAVTSINLIGGGSGFTSAPLISFSTSGSTAPATATANVTGGVVTSITLNSGGSAYTGVPNVVFDAQSNGYSTSHGILDASIGNVEISGNSIGSITTVGTNAYSHGFESMYIRTNVVSVNITNNLIGSLTEPNSIFTSSSAINSLVKQDVYGIYCSVTGTATITGNTIANLSNGYAGTNSASRARGIATTSGSNIIENNIVRDIKSASAQNSGGTSASIIGISQSSNTSNKIQSVKRNQVYNLSCTHPTAANVISGIYISSPTTQVTDVSGNFVHHISCVSNNIASEIDGIYLYGGKNRCFNNIISLGSDISNGDKIYGIIDEGGSPNNNTIYFNTVYIGGTVTSSVTSATSALLNKTNTSTKIYKNNIFSNFRTGGSSGKHYAIILSGTSYLTINNNDYYAAGNMLSRIGSTDRANFTALCTGTGQDNFSKNINPGYSSAGGANALDYETSASLDGVTITGITEDYSGITREIIPKMGALEIQNYSWKGTLSTNFATAGNWLENRVPPSGANIVFDANPLNNCVLDQDRTVGSIYNAQSADKLVINGKNLTINRCIYLSNGAQIDATQNTSSLIFAGASSQNIPTGSFVNNSVYSLTVNNSEGIILSSNLNIAQSLNLVKGKITIGDNTLTAKSISGGSAQSYIVTTSAYNAVSPGYLAISSVGASEVCFPVGTSTNYNPCYITNRGTGGAKDFKVRVFSGVYINGLSGAALAADDLLPIVNRTWEIVPEDQNNVDAEIVFQWNAAEEGTAFATNRTKAFVSKNRHIAGDDTWTQIPSESFTTLASDIFQIHATHINTFSTFALGSPGSVLPIELLYFTGVKKDNSVKLSWATSSEINNDYFTIEKSSDGTTYNEIGTLDGAGNSNSKLTYTFTDDAPDIGMNYYKLKQTDFDGKYEYFNIVPVNFSATEKDIEQITVNPNPFTTTININYKSTTSEPVEIVLYDLGGKILKKIQFESEEGINIFTWSDFAETSQGIYLIGLEQSKKKTQLIKIIKSQ